jgi:hypothetical protein
MGPYRAQGSILVFGWITAAVMALAAAGMLIPAPRGTGSFEQGRLSGPQRVT